MKHIKLSLKRLVLILAVMAGFVIHSNAQLKVGNNPTAINPNAILEMQSTNKGLLLPRVALNATNSPAPLTNFVQGMLVYDTVSVGDITPGMYYCDGTKWIKLSATTSTGNAWNMKGNADTDPDVDFIGTTDNKPLLFKTNGRERLRVTRNGRVGLGTNSPDAALHVNGDVIIGSLVTGNVATDSLLLVDPQSGLIKKASFSTVSVKVMRSLETVVFRSQMLFSTPASITDMNKISLYRNGVQISFSMRNSTTIVSEVPCDIGDEVRIIQLL